MSPTQCAAPDRHRLDRAAAAARRARRLVGRSRAAARVARRPPSGRSRRRRAGSPTAAARSRPRSRAGPRSAPARNRARSGRPQRSADPAAGDRHQDRAAGNAGSQGDTTRSAMSMEDSPGRLQPVGQNPRGSWTPSSGRRPSRRPSRTPRGVAFVAHGRGSSPAGIRTASRGPSVSTSSSSLIVISPLSTKYISSIGRGCGHRSGRRPAAYGSSRLQQPYVEGQLPEPIGRP